MAHKLSPARRVLRQASQPDRKAASFVASLACLVLYAHVQCAFGEIVEVTVDPLREYGAEVYLEAGCYRISVDGEVHTNPGGSVSGCDEWTDAAGVCEACRYQNPWGHCFMALFASLGDDCGPDDDVLCGWMPAHSPEFEACEETTLHLRVADVDWGWNDNRGEFDVVITPLECSDAGLPDCDVETSFECRHEVATCEEWCEGEFGSSTEMCDFVACQGCSPCSTESVSAFDHTKGMPCRLGNITGSGDVPAAAATSRGAAQATLIGISAVTAVVVRRWLSPQ